MRAGCIVTYTSCFLFCIQTHNLVEVFCLVFLPDFLLDIQCPVGHFALPSVHILAPFEQAVELDFVIFFLVSLSLDDIYGPVVFLHKEIGTVLSAN